MISPTPNLPSKCLLFILGGLRPLIDNVDVVWRWPILLRERLISFLPATNNGFCQFVMMRFFLKIIFVISFKWVVSVVDSFLCEKLRVGPSREIPNYSPVNTGGLSCGTVESFSNWLSALLCWQFIINLFWLLLWYWHQYCNTQLHEWKSLECFASKN